MTNYSWTFLFLIFETFPQHMNTYAVNAFFADTLGNAFGAKRSTQKFTQFSCFSFLCVQFVCYFFDSFQFHANYFFEPLKLWKPAFPSPPFQMHEENNELLFRLLINRPRNFLRINAIFLSFSNFSTCPMSFRNLNCASKAHFVNSTIVRHFKIALLLFKISLRGSPAEKSGNKRSI